MPVGSMMGVRLARHQEVSAIGALVSNAFAPFANVLPRHIFEPYVNDACDPSRRWAEADIAVLESQGQLVGTVTYYADATREGLGWAPELAGIRTLAVDPAMQGRGYGRALCEWCVTRAREQRAAGLALHTASFMTSAGQLYESLGFQRRPSHDLLASDVIGFDPVRGDLRILAYLLPLRENSDE